jgi:glycine/D-amino acid oxidase-like deaminating enzyme
LGRAFIIKRQADKLIIGAGLYGLYAALFCARRGEKVIVLECDREAFSRATFVNQARVYLTINPKYKFHFSTSVEELQEVVDMLNNDLENYLDRKEE